jgi:predicted lipoprotein with Yx(FWY)xxD motif
MRHLLKLSIPAIAASFLIVACGGSSSSKTIGSTTGGEPAQTSNSTSSAIIKTASSPAIGTILVNGQGMTLYHLAGEQNGKFICTSSACLGIWHPLTAPSGGAPSGEVSSLSTVKRPDGTVQVTYKGTPLYTFAQDQRAGETNGQGIKDVGTWSAVTISSAGTPSTNSTPATPAPSSGGYGY